MVILDHRAANLFFKYLCFGDGVEIQWGVDRKGLLALEVSLQKGSHDDSFDRVADAPMFSLEGGWYSFR